MFIETVGAATGTTLAAPAGRPATRRVWNPYFYVLPAVILLLVWTYWPLFQTVNLSFYDWNLIPTKPKVFVGTEKYATVLSLPELHQALLNTALYILAFLVISVALPVVFALLSRRVEGRARTAYQAPNYVLVSQMGLLNTVTGVVLPQLCSAFAVMMLRQHLEAFPKDLLDASQMDGRTSWRTLWEVVVPNLRPALAALGIMLFISAWNEYLWPSLIMQKSDALIQVGIRGFLGAEGNNWGAIMAASALACLPIFLIYIFLQRYVVDAFVRSGLK